MQQARILMCPPTHFGIEYEINPWMNRARGANSELACRQWQNLRDTLVHLGALVELIEPRPGLPDLVFTANAGLVFKNRFISSRFKHEVRAQESPHFDAWFAKRGFDVEHLPEGMYFEGAGDALFCGSTLFAGYRIRSDAAAHQAVAARIGKEVLPLELVSPRFYHLDTCFCPLAPGTALYHPPAFDRYAQKVLERAVDKLISVGEEDAQRFGCNAVVVGKSVVINAGCANLAADLERAGFEPHSVELGEFLKSGGSAKCLTLRLDGEEATVW
jgi:N-dimethylarginine dimethylaminohydrolase